MTWYPSKTALDDDDDPTVARPKLCGDDDDEPTVARPAAQPDAGLGAAKPGAVQLQPGALLNHRYQLIQQIGKGGMGEVWEARHLQLAHGVAIKFLTHEAGGPRFKREAQAIVSIRHSGVIDVLDFGETEQGVPYFVMELVKGETLTARVRRQGPLSWALVRNIALELSDALAHAHAIGVIHRDLKPSNVLVLDSPPPRGSSTKLIDFGIAKLLDADLPRLTRAGYIQGTPAYMSPEQVLGETVDGRADVYGLGCLLYYLLSGRKPFPGKAGTEALRAQLYEMPPSFALAAPDAMVPPMVEAVVMQAMAKAKHARFESMIAMQGAMLAIPPDASASMSRVLPPVHLHPSSSTLSASNLSASNLSASNLSASNLSASNLSASGGAGTLPGSSAAASASETRPVAAERTRPLLLAGALSFLAAALLLLLWVVTR